MARQKFEKTFNTFTKGLMTEASELNFPEDFSLYEKNFVLKTDGGRDRRLGMEVLYPLGVTLTSTLYPIEFEDSYGVVPQAPSVDWATPPLDSYSVTPLPPRVEITSTVRYLDYDNGAPESYSVTPLAPSVSVVSRVRYLEYRDGQPEAYSVVPMPPEVTITTSAGYVEYRMEPESYSVTPLAPEVRIDTQ